MRCFVSGANGFLGQAVVRHLHAEGHHVIGMVREQAQLATVQETGATAVIRPLGDPAAIAEAAQGCDVVVHCAGIVAADASQNALGWVHIAGTENMLNAARFAGCQRFIHISCADSTLQRGPRTFWDETRVSAGEPYGALAKSKLAAEELVQVSGCAQMQTLILRPAVLWGAGDRNFVPRYCELAAKGMRLVGDGKYLLATTHVDNAAHAVVCALKGGPEDSNVYYVVDAEASLARDFFGALSQALGLPPPRSGPGLRLQRLSAYLRTWLPGGGLTQHELARLGVSTSFNGSRARNEIGYEPVITQHEGMQRLGEWARGVGVDALRRARRPAPTDQDIAAQKALANRAASLALPEGGGG